MVQDAGTTASSRPSTSLPERERNVVQLRFGLGGEEPTPLRETGRRLGICAERVRQIEEDALGRLAESGELRRCTKQLKAAVGSRQSAERGRYVAPPLLMVRRVVNPFSIPGDVIGALRVLPVILERLEEIQGNTSSMAGDTRCLPSVNEAIQSVSSDTDCLRTMDRRMATIEDAMPTLVEVQKHLANLPEIIEGLQSGIDRMTELLEGLMGSLQRLDGDVESLQASIEPLGRVADRIPGGRKQA